MNDLLKGHALIIGINEYHNSISSLQSAVQDANAISDLLRDNHDYDVTCLLNEDATAEAIYDAIEHKFADILNEESAFLLYFAGHGVARGDGSEGPKGYLLPVDATTGSPDSWVSMERIRRALDSYKNRHMLIVLDCCFAGSFRWTSTRDVPTDMPLYESQYQRFLRGQAWQVLTSASHDEKAMDVAPGAENTRDTLNAKGHSPFASALLAGLSGEADSAQGKYGPDGVITATELYQYAFNTLVPADARSHQTPGIWPLRPDNEGQYIFKNPKHPKNTVPDPPLDDEHNPWIGLKSYQIDDAAIFFGRETVIDDIIEQLISPEHGNFTAVVGASGTGKSSVVKAGVLPHLTEDGWNIVQAERISAAPMESLAASIEQLKKTAQGTQSLLFIDQFEELYTLCHDEKLRESYLTTLKQLIEQDNHIYVMITLRSDFAPRLSRSEIFGELWQQSKYQVPVFSSENLRQCIEGPAGTKAIFFENEELIADIIDDVMAMPGALPLLSFSLSEMYRTAHLRRRETGANDRAIMRADYDATGGVIGSLHRRASELFEDSTQDMQATIKRIFLRMVSQDGARIARRRIELKELEYPDKNEQARVSKVIDDYVNARLLVIDNESIEPAHDTLLIAWKMLLDWLSESGPQALLRSLWRSASDWQANKRDNGLTWHDDPRLPQALAKIKEDELNALEQRFVFASERRRKFKRRLVALFSTIIVAGIAASWFVISKNQQDKELALQEAEFKAEEVKIARETRDYVFLDILQRGNFFSLADMLGRNSQGGVIEIDEYWVPLVTVPDQGVFVAGRVYGEGRVLAVGHENFLTYVDKNNESLFLELSLDWLLPADKESKIYLTHNNLETLPRYNAAGYNKLRSDLLAAQFDLSPEELPFAQALQTASLVIVPNAWADFTDAEIAAIEEHVFYGGGLLVAGLGWSWRDFGPHGLENRSDAISVYPMNRLMANFGVQWSDNPFWVR